MSTRALITGGAGFIGSHLAERLLNETNTVCVLDDLSTGSLDNLTHLLEEPRFSFVQGDVTDPSIVKKLVRQSDHIFHLAAAVGVKRVVDNPIESMATNVKGTEIVLEASVKYQKAIIIASSSEVYGKSAKVPFSEDDDLILGSTQHLRWSYAASKAIDEFLALAQAARVHVTWSEEYRRSQRVQPPWPHSTTSRGDKGPGRLAAHDPCSKDLG